VIPYFLLAILGTDDILFTVMAMTGLMLHCGASQVPYEEVEQSHTPDSTDTWTPVPHSRLVTEVRSHLDRANITVKEESHALTHDGGRYFGLFRLGQEGATEYGSVMGVRNSHDKRFPASLVFGANVFVCDNLSFMGEVKLSRKHTRHIMRDLPQVVSRTLGKLADHWNFQEKRFDAYKERELSNMQANDLIIRGMLSGACTKTHVMDIVHQWRTPNHDEFKPRNAWSMFNAFTEVLKGNLNALPKRTEALHGLMDGECGVAPQRELSLAS